MADIIDKIGKYFADQEAQMRVVYAHAAAANAAEPLPRRVAGKTPHEPAKDATHPQRGTPSLLRRRLSLEAATEFATSTAKGKEEMQLTRRMSWGSQQPKENVGEAKRVLEVPAAHASDRLSTPFDNSSSKDSMLTTRESVWEADMSSSSSSASQKLKKTKKPKRKPKKKKPQMEQADVEKEKALQRTVDDGLAKAQERARRIQQDKAFREKQQRAEREAAAVRLQEEMHKIEEIRRKGKQFAIRLRPQSAPSTPQLLASDSTTTPTTARSTTTAETSGSSGSSQAETQPKNSFLRELERQMHDKMMLEMTVNDRIQKKQAHEQAEWMRLQAQIKKTSDRNVSKQERVDGLIAEKKELEKQIVDAQTNAIAYRQDRHQLEETVKKQRQLKQRGAEREIQARLRQEESQRLVDEERKQSDAAAEARGKARKRVQSRAALLKRVLHGCDIRSSDGESSNNNEEDMETSAPGKGRTTKVAAAPELAEFEEDGLVSSGVLDPSMVFATTLNERLATSSPSVSIPAFRWQVPVLPAAERHRILLQDLLLSASESEDQNDSDADT